VPLARGVADWSPERKKAYESFENIPYNIEKKHQEGFVKTETCTQNHLYGIARRKRYFADGSWREGEGGLVRKRLSSSPEARFGRALAQRFQTGREIL